MHSCPQQQQQQQQNAGLQNRDDQRKHLKFRERSLQHPLRKREKGKKCGLIHTEAHLVPDQRETVGRIAADVH